MALGPPSLGSDPGDLHSLEPSHIAVKVIVRFQVYPKMEAPAPPIILAVPNHPVVILPPEQILGRFPTTGKSNIP